MQHSYADLEEELVGIEEEEYQEEEREYNTRTYWRAAYYFWIVGLREIEGKTVILVARNRFCDNLFLIPEEKVIEDSSCVLDLIIKRRKIEDLSNQHSSHFRTKEEIEETLSILKSLETENWLEALPFAEKAHNQFWTR